MKILLINPAIKPEKFGKFHILMEPMPCIGLAYIAAVLEKDGHEVSIIDNYVHRYNDKELLDIVIHSSPDIVGFSVLTPSVRSALSLAGLIKKTRSNIITIAGNVHPTLFPHEFLLDGKFDIVVRGEGEETMSELVRTIAAKGSLENVRGISFLLNGAVVNNEKRPAISDPDKLPVPAWHLLPYRKYGLFPFADIRKPLLTVMATRGCPFSCKYCSLSYMDKSYRKRSPGKVVDEMVFLINKFGLKQMGFVDPIFPLEEEYANELCDEMIKRGIPDKVVWTTETKVDILNRKIIEKLKKAGCRRVIFGIESAYEETLKGIGKTIDPVKTAEVIKLIRINRMESIGLFMIGLPGETPELIQKTFDYACDLDLDFAKFAMTVPFPGSELYEVMKQTKKIRTDDWENFTTFNPVPDNIPYVPDGMKAQQLIDLQRKGTIQFYLRPKMIVRQLFYIRTLKLKTLIKGVYCLLPW